MIKQQTRFSEENINYEADQKRQENIEKKSKKLSHRYKAYLNLGIK